MPLLLAIVCGGIVVAVLTPWIHANPSPGITFSAAPYSDEGIYNQAGRNFAVFGRTGTDQLDVGLTDGGYAAATAVVYKLTSVSITHGRFLSILSIALAVALAVAGLAGPLGRLTALLVGAGLVASQLVLLYGRTAMVEPYVLFWMVAAFVAMAHAVQRRSWRLGALSGVALGIGAWAKLDGLLPAPAIVGVPLLLAIIARRRDRFYAPLGALGAFLVASAGWWLIVGLPNYGRLQTVLSAQIHDRVRLTSVAVVRRLIHDYIHQGGDQAIHFNRVLVAAVAVSVIAVVARWRHVDEGGRHAMLTGLVWAAVTWGAIVLRGYSPNRYVVLVVPGLALAAAPGLAALIRVLADAVSHISGRASVGTVVRRTAGGAMAVALAAAGIVPFLHQMSPLAGTHQLRDDQRVIADALPPHARVYGVYAPIMCFGTDAVTVTPWPDSGVNMTDPQRSFGINYFLVDATVINTPTIKKEIHAVSPDRPLAKEDIAARVRWGPHILVLYRIHRTAS